MMDLAESAIWLPRYQTMDNMYLDDMRRHAWLTPFCWLKVFSATAAFSLHSNVSSRDHVVKYERQVPYSGHDGLRLNSAVVLCLPKYFLTKYFLPQAHMYSCNISILLEVETKVKLLDLFL